jgi:hypothetical protein
MPRLQKTRCLIPLSGQGQPADLSVRRLDHPNISGLNERSSFSMEPL